MVYRLSKLVEVDILEKGLCGAASYCYNTQATQVTEELAIQSVNSASCQKFVLNNFYNQSSLLQY